jgi:hypothetical protein
MFSSGYTHSCLREVEEREREERRLTEIEKTQQSGKKSVEPETLGSDHGSRETGRKTSSQRLKTR